MKNGSDQRTPPGQDPQSLEAWIRALVEQSPLGISISRDGTTLYANRACARLFGYDSPDEIVGTSQLGRVASESRAQVAENIRRRRMGEPAPSAYEITGLRRDGSTFPLYAEVKLIEWDDGPVSMAYFRDVTEKKRVEAALIESERRFRNLVESIDEFLAENDTDAAFTYASPRSLDMLGYRPDELLGKAPFDFMVADEAKRGKEIFRNAVIRREPLHAIEYAFPHRSGRTVILETSAVPYFDKRGALVGYRSITRDVTTRKEMEESLRKAREELEARVRERTQELADVNEALLRDIAERRRIEEALRQREEELELRSLKLEEMNVTLRTILEQRDQDRRILEQRVADKIGDLVKPLLEKLGQCRSDAQRESCLKALETNLNEIVSPLTGVMARGLNHLTATEMQVADCIRRGMRSKEIAALLGLSKGTIDFHRNNIRRKLGLTGSKTGLRSHLLQLAGKT